MGNVAFDNYFLTSEIEDQYNSHLNLQQFCTVDTSLTGTAGMLRKIHVYKATDGTEKLAMGEGNTKAISVHFAEREYRIQLAQNRFHFYDEEEMTDPMIRLVGVQHASTDLFNTTNADIYDEFNKATLNVKTDNLDFSAFIDAASALNVEDIETTPLFGFVCPADMGEIRKNLKDDLKYVESFSRNGYVGTVGGINLYTKKDAIPGTVIVATKEAVTIFTKKGTEVEQERDANHRGNYVYSRKYYIVALTDETKAVKIVKNGTSDKQPMPKNKISLPTEGDDLLGKTVHDLIGADVVIGNDGAVTGTIKKVTNYTKFSSAKAQQSGYYFPMIVTAPGQKIKITTEGGTPKEVDVVNNPDGRMWIILLDKQPVTSDTIKIEVDGTELTKLTFTNATFA